MNFILNISGIQAGGKIQSFTHSKYWCSTHHRLKVREDIFIASVNTLHVTNRLPHVSEPQPPKPSAVLLSAAGQTQTRYFEYIGYSLKESAW